MELHHVTTCSRAKKEGYQEAMGRGFECRPNITYAIKSSRDIT